MCHEHVCGWGGYEYFFGSCQTHSAAVKSPFTRIVKDDDYDDVLFDGWIRSKHVDLSKLKNPVSLLRPSPGEIHVMAL